MRTEEEVKKEMAELGEKFDILQNSDSATMWHPPPEAEQQDCPTPISSFLHSPRLPTCTVNLLPLHGPPPGPRHHVLSLPSYAQ